MGYTPETRKKLVEEAKKYECVENFIDDIGWDADWMPDFMDDPDYEFLTIYDERAINEVLVSAFEEAHRIHFHRKYRWQLINR